jgi:hypothetical protein
MRRMVRTKNLKHPVLWDDECRNTKAYGITAWPFVYLIGTDGKVFWEGNPSRWIRRPKKMKEMRALIERKLFEENSDRGPFFALRAKATAVHSCSQGAAHSTQGKEDEKVHCSTENDLQRLCAWIRRKTTYIYETLFRQADSVSEK